MKEDDDLPGAGPAISILAAKVVGRWDAVFSCFSVGTGGLLFFDALQFVRRQVGAGNETRRIRMFNSFAAGGCGAASGALVVLPSSLPSPISCFAIVSTANRVKRSLAWLRRVNGPGPALRKLLDAGEDNMLTHVQVAILRDISQSIAFADDRHGEVEQLIIEGYVMKAGDLYELTSKGLRVVEDHPTESGAS